MSWVLWGQPPLSRPRYQPLQEGVLLPVSLQAVSLQTRVTRGNGCFSRCHPAPQKGKGAGPWEPQFPAL